MLVQFTGNVEEGFEEDRMGNKWYDEVKEDK
jgi:hypothetical protein